MARNYSSVATEKTLAQDVTNVATTITLNNITGFPSPPYTLVLNPDTAIEEIVTVVEDQSGISAPQLRVTRAQEGTIAQVHTVGNVVKHMITARDLQEPQDHIESTENVHGISDTAFLVYTNAAQTLTNKTMSGSTNSFSNIPQSAVVDLVSDLAATDTALSNHEADTTNVHGIADTSILATTTSTQTLTNKTLTTPRINEAVNVTVTSTEINRLNGVTSNVQTQINTLTSNLGSAVPTGTLSMFAGSLAPTGYLICDGSEVSRTTYSALWDVLRGGTSSSPYGNGNGTTTFNLPDLRGRAPIGAGTGRNVANTANLTNRTLGNKVSDDEGVILTVAQLPSYNHEYQISSGGGNDGTTYFKTTSGPYSNSLFYPHGSNQPHNNMQPSTVVNFIIKH